MDAVIQNANLIVTGAIAGVFALIALFGVIFGFWRGTIRTATRTVTLVLSAVLSLVIIFVLNLLLVPIAEPFVKNYLVGLLSTMSADAGALFAETETMVSYVLKLVLAAIAPFLFVVIFFLLRLVTFPLYKLFSGMICRMVSRDKHKSFLSRLGGVAISLVGSVVIAICCLMPVTGYVSYATEIYPTVMATGYVPEGVVPAGVDEQVAVIHENPALAAVRLLGGDILFSISTDMGKSRVTDEITFVVNTAKDAKPAVDQLMADNPELMSVARGELAVTQVREVPNTEALDTVLIPLLDSASPEMKSIVAEILNMGSDIVLENKTVFGYNVSEKLGEDGVEAARPLLERLSNVEAETLTAEVEELADTAVGVAECAIHVFELMADNPLDPLTSGEAVLNTEAYEKILPVVEENAIIKEVLSGVISRASTKIKNGETYFGVDVKSWIPEGYRDDTAEVMDILLTELTDVKSDTVVEELRSLGDTAVGVSECLVRAFDLVEANPMEPITNGEAVLDTTAVDEILLVVEDDKLLKQVVAHVLSTGSGKWTNGETYFGFDVKSFLPEEYRADASDVVDVLLERLEQVNTDTVVENLREVSNTAVDVTACIGPLRELAEANPADVVAAGDTVLNLEALDSKILPIVEQDALLKEIFTKVLSTGAGRWKAGEVYFGVDLKSGLNPDIVSTADILLDRLAATTADTVVKDLGEVGDAAEDATQCLVYVKEIEAANPTDKVASGEQKLDLVALDKILPIIEKDDILREMFADILKRGGGSWQEGDSFLGLDLTAMLGEDYQGTADVLLERLATTTKDTVVKDLEDIGNAAEDASECLIYAREIPLANPSEKIANGEQVLDLSALDKIIPLLEKDPLLREVFADVMRDTAVMWENGEDALGMNLVAMLGNEYADSANILLDVLVETTDETLIEDLLLIQVSAVDLSQCFVYLLSVEKDNPMDLVSTGNQVLNMDVIYRDVIPLMETGPDIKRELLADIMRRAATEWKAGNSYLGVSMRDIIANFQTSGDTLFNRLENTTSDTVLEDLKVFSDDLVVLSRTYVYFVHMQDEEKNSEDLKENLTEIVTTVTPDTVGIIKDTLASEITGSTGIGEENGAAVDLLGDALGNIAELPEEERAKEADALNNVLNYATGNNTEEVDESAVVDTLLNSTAISNTIVNTVEKNNNAETEEEKTQISVTEEQKTQLESIIDEKLAADSELPPEEQTLTEEQKAMLAALKDLFIVKP